MHQTDDCLGPLRRAGWGVGYAAFGATWQVDETNGGNGLLALAATLEETYGLACSQARAGGLAPRMTPREETDARGAVAGPMLTLLEPGFAAPKLANGGRW